MEHTDTVDVGQEWVQVIVDESADSTEAVRVAQDSGLSVYTIPADAPGEPVLRVKRRGFEREYYGLKDIRAAVHELASNPYRNGNAHRDRNGISA